MRSGESQLHHFSLTADEASEEGMVCGGTMDIFVEVISNYSRCHKISSLTTKPSTSIR